MTQDTTPTSPTATLERWMAEEAAQRERIAGGCGHGVASLQRVAELDGLQQLQALLRGESPAAPIGRRSPRQSATCARNGRQTRARAARQTQVLRKDFISGNYKRGSNTGIKNRVGVQLSRSGWPGAYLPAVTAVSGENVVYPKCRS